MILACTTLAKSYQGYARQSYSASGTRLFRLFLVALDCAENNHLATRISVDDYGVHFA